MKSKISTIPSLWALACAAALAQTPPAEPLEQKEAEEPKPMPKVELGWASWGLRGSKSTTFSRYATISKGLFFRELSFGLYDASPGLFGEFVFRGRPDEDFAFDAQAVFGPRATSFKFSSENADFNQPSTVIVDESGRRGVQGTLRQEFGSNLDLVLDFNTSRVDKTFEPPAFATHYNSDTVGGKVSANLGGGQASLALTDRHFYDNVNFQPDSHTQTWRGAVNVPVGQLGLEGSYTHSKIEQVGWQDSKVRAWNLDGIVDLNPELALQFGFEQKKYDLPNSLNAYVRERFTSFARLSGRWGGILGDIGYKHVEVERVRDAHDFVDVPQFNILEGRVYGRFAGGPRWTLKGTWENLDGTAVMHTEDPRRLFWDDKAKVQLRVEHGEERWTGYAAFNHRFFQNQERDIEVRTNQYILGGTYQHKPNLDFFGEIQVDFANTDFTEPGGLYSLDSFFPSSRVFTFGANWAIDPDNHLSASFTEITTDNDNPIGWPEGNIYSRFISAHWTHRTKTGHEFGLLLAPGRYSDRIFRSLGYDSNVVMVTAKVKF